MSDSIEELLKFVQIGARLDLKALALEHILGLSGTETGVETIINLPQLLVSLIALFDDNSQSISKDSALTLINISAHEKGAVKLIDLNVANYNTPLQSPPQDVINTILKFILNPESHLADPCCMILSNLTRPMHLNEKIIEIIGDDNFDAIINVFTKKKFNKNANLHYLGPVLSNLSQSSRIRKRILDVNKCVVQKLLPFIEFKESLIRRGGVIGTLKNCCFDSETHEFLLSPDVDILPRLLLPLAGNEEFDEEDNDKLPLDLQYLPETKKREDEPDLRCMLLEAITQLCTLRKNREFIRDSNTYIILRELHKWEKDRKALLACENLVDILIRTEEEIGRDDLGDVHVPDDVQQKFVKEDEEFLHDV